MPLTLKKSQTPTPEPQPVAALPLTLETAQAIQEVKVLASALPLNLGARKVARVLAKFEGSALFTQGLLASQLLEKVTRLEVVLGQTKDLPDKKAVTKELRDSQKSIRGLAKLVVKKTQRVKKNQKIQKAYLDTSNWSEPRLIIDGMTSIPIDTSVADLLWCVKYTAQSMAGYMPERATFTELSKELGRLDGDSRYEENVKRTASELLGSLTRIEAALDGKVPGLVKVVSAAKADAESIVRNGLSAPAPASPSATPAPAPNGASSPASEAGTATPPPASEEQKSAMLKQLGALSSLARAPLDSVVPIWKSEAAPQAGATEERVALGPVLIPDTVDLQNDAITAEEIEKAADHFMEFYRNRGLQHSDLVNDKVSILQSYCAPCEFSIGERVVKKGTWLMKVRYHDEEIWQLVKNGKIKGFSIGGSGLRKPRN